MIFIHWNGYFSCVFIIYPHYKFGSKTFKSYLPFDYLAAINIINGLFSKS